MMLKRYQRHGKILSVGCGRSSGKVDGFEAWYQIIRLRMAFGTSVLIEERKGFDSLYTAEGEGFKRL